MNVIRSSGIRDVIDIEARLDLWDAGRYEELVREVVIKGK